MSNSILSSSFFHHTYGIALYTLPDLRACSFSAFIKSFQPQNLVDECWWIYCLTFTKHKSKASLQQWVIGSIRCLMILEGQILMAFLHVYFWTSWFLCVWHEVSVALHNLNYLKGKIISYKLFFLLIQILFSFLLIIKLPLVRVMIGLWYILCGNSQIIRHWESSSVLHY